MELSNEIEVNAGVEEVWAAFNDPERIAPCLPGAQLQEIEGEEMRGVVKVKVGPITAQYKGAAVYQERDKDNWRIVIKGDGRGSSGNASALITAKLDPLADDKTKVNVDTDLTITGKVAQFGRGAIADVSTKLMGQFADNLETLIEEGGGEEAAEEPAPAEAATDDGSAEPAVRKIDSPEAEAVDLLDVAGTPLLQRIALPVGVLFVLIVLRRMLRGG
ncbi:MAG: SRPBCC family protein [Actinomycetota bacterium]